MSKPANITALVSYKIFPAKMGGQKGIALFYQYLSELLPVTIITTRNNAAPENLQAVFLPILSNSKLRYADPLLFFSTRKILKRHNSRQLILEHPYYGWLGILLKKICGIQLVIHSHNIEAIRFKSTGKQWWKLLWHYEKYVHRQADINFFITDEDRQFAISNFNLVPGCCHTITYGFEMSATISQEEKASASALLRAKYNIPPDEKILLFNGTLDYKPNLDALSNILEYIHPILQSTEGFKYRIIICGKGLPDSFNGLRSYADKNILYAGFVDDISIYFKAADIFINPVTDGGGIKTKVVEALGYNLTVVSTRSGATGIPAAISYKKLYQVEDGDWGAFAAAILQADPHQKIPPAFFDHFYWGNIAAKVKTILTAQQNNL